MNPNTKAVSNNSSKKKKQPSTSKKVFFNIAKILLITFVILSCATVGALSGLVLGYIRTADPISPEQMQVSKFTSFVYDANEQEIAQLKGEENRIWVDDKDIPQHVKDAFVALEDERFFEHPGVDIWGLASAAFKKITHPGTPMRGASTITQQAIKVITGNDERSPRRKVQEQYNALILEKKLDKWQILELYMNLVIMGPNIYGVETASRYYFNKSTGQLTIAEAACIAGITNNPSIYSPITTKGRENNKKRQKDCLNNMLRLKKITQQQYDEAINEELHFEEGNIKNNSKQSYFVDQVITDVKNDLVTKYKYTEQAAYRIIYSGGVKIYTTMDSNVQNAMDTAFKNDANFPKGNKDKSTEFAAQAAMVVIDPSTGQVKGLYGGYGEKKGDMIFNYATQAKRQPGSTIKPLAAYGPALDLRQITAGTVLDDVQVFLDPNNKSAPYPRNYDHQHYGLMAIRDAIRTSNNVIAAKVWMNLGLDQSLKYLKRAGIELDKKKDNGPAISLGGLTDGISTLQLTAAYVPFVNKGMYIQPTTYSKVLDSSGKVLLENKPKSNIVYDDERTPYIMTDMLKDVLENGTAAGYTIKNGSGQSIPSGGKTGTTSDNKDKWFVGFSKYYVGATWYGYRNPTVIPEGERNNALKIWYAVMTQIHKDLKPVDFERPQGIVEKNFCLKSGKVATELCPLDPRGQETIRYGELFIKGTEPRDEDKCDVHVLAKVDKDSRDGSGRMLLAGPNCPPSSIEEKVFVKRREPFVPAGPDSPYPLDWIYEYPAGKYCQIHNDPGSLNPDGTLKVPLSPTPKPGASPGPTTSPKPGETDNKNSNPLKDLFDRIKGNETTDKPTDKPNTNTKSN